MGVWKIISKLLIYLGKPLFFTLIYLLQLTELSNRFLFQRVRIKYLALLLLLSATIASAIFTRNELVRFKSSLPSISLLHNSPEISSRVYDSDGNLLYTFYSKVNRLKSDKEKIPEHLRNATIVAEDQNFYSHNGISPVGMVRSLINLIKDGTVSGGSTITQQLIKNTLLTPERSVERKIKEIILAIDLEKEFSKDEILTLYLNRVSYGGVIAGVQSASEFYFDKNVSDLSISESALLASLPKYPNEIITNPNTDSVVFDRQKKVLRQMFEKGYIDKNQMESAMSENINLAMKSQNIVFPHTVMLTSKLLKRDYPNIDIGNTGLEIKTTISNKVQTMAEKVVKEEVEKLKNYNVSNASTIVVDVASGKIISMVGSKDYWDQKIDGSVNVADRLRQPGSSIKVVTYAYALSHGMNPATTILDTPTTFLPKGGKPYTPKNYEGGFKGQMSLRSALAQSRNIPAVKLINQFGVKQIFDLGKKMGIKSWSNPNNYGLSLTLGGGEITLIELAQVYNTIANMGEKVDLRLIESINGTKTDSCVLGSYCERERVLDPKVAFQIINILSDNEARSPAFGPNSQLVIKGYPEVAAKTGTSNNLKDNLAIGFNQKYLVAVWVGNNDGTPMARISSGVTGATPIWNRIMTELVKDTEQTAWRVPEGLKLVSVCGRREWMDNNFSEKNVVCKGEEMADKKYPNRST